MTVGGQEGRPRRAVAAPAAHRRPCDGAPETREPRDHPLRHRILSLSRDHRLRFAAVGLGVTGVHVAVLTALLPLVLADLANALAFVVATQVNFAASYSWTWASRRGPERDGAARLLRRLGLFNASALVAFGVNAAGFSLLHRLLDAPPLLSALAATVVSAVVSFAVSSRLVFARRVHVDRASSLPPVPLPPVVQTVAAASAHPAVAADLTGAAAR